MQSWRPLEKEVGRSCPVRVFHSCTEPKLVGSNLKLLPVETASRSSFGEKAKANTLTPLMAKRVRICPVSELRMKTCLIRWASAVPSIVATNRPSFEKTVLVTKEVGAVHRVRSAADAGVMARIKQKMSEAKNFIRFGFPSSLRRGLWLPWNNRRRCLYDWNTNSPARVLLATSAAFRPRPKCGGHRPNGRTRFR